MKEYKYDVDDLITALATPWGKSALAVIRTSGKGCIEAVSRLFKGSKKLSLCDPNTMIKGFIFDPDTEGLIDEVMAAVYRDPASFTGQDSVEIFCHGSLAGIKTILDLLFSNGFRQASPGEFTFRAFVNGKMDLTRAEAVQEIVNSRTSQAQSLALTRLNGSIEKKIRQIKDDFTEVSTRLSIQLDYPEDEVDSLTLPIAKIEEAQKQLGALVKSFRSGKIYQEGIRVALAGRTNAGKSSLFNLLLKEDRSIVSESHGTTRDFVEAWISLDGLPVCLIDTAGFREADHPVEKEGIKRSSRVVDGADLVLYLVDSSEGITREDTDFIEKFPEKNKLVCLWNKIDLSHKPAPEGWVASSGISAEGLEAIGKEVEKKLDIAAHNQDSAVIDSLRQKELLERAMVAVEGLLEGISLEMPLDVLAVDVQEILNSLGEITGEVSSADILHRMFSQFCVGK